MQKAIEILESELYWAKEEGGMEENVADLQAAINHLQSAVLIDREPLNTLLVNALRSDNETQRLLIKNIIERNSKLRVRKDPRIYGMRELFKLNKGERSNRLLVWFEHGLNFGYYEDGTWYEEGDIWVTPYTTSEILYYADPNDIL